LDTTYSNYYEHQSLDGEITEYGNYGVTNPWDVKYNDLPDSSSSKYNPSRITTYFDVSYSLFWWIEHEDTKSFSELLAIQSDILRKRLYPFHCFF